MICRGAKGFYLALGTLFRQCLHTLYMYLYMWVSACESVSNAFVVCLCIISRGIIHHTCNNKLERDVGFLQHIHNFIFESLQGTTRATRRVDKDQEPATGRWSTCINIYNKCMLSLASWINVFLVITTEQAIS